MSPENPHSTTAASPIAPAAPQLNQIDRPRACFRSDFGQKRTDFAVDAPGVGSPAAQKGIYDSDASIPRPPEGSCAGSQSPAPRIWDRWPDESAEDFNLFGAWLRLPAPRRIAAAGKTLGCSVNRLRRLAPRFDWKGRAKAFDTCRAEASTEAIHQLLAHERLDWKARAELFREQEWALHEIILETALESAAAWRRKPGRCSLSDLVRLLNLASTLGRAA